ncbi:MAG: alpha/beta hydrolase [Crocinitomicaceae bacterium]|nr:alpha/beta hydrolase [Crocinitomicaceae bacterium]
MRIVLTVILFLSLLSSCAFNKLFLYPYELDTDESFSSYMPDVKDTLTLTFSTDKQPIIKNSQDSIAKVNYNLNSVSFPNSNGDSLYAWFFEPKENYNGTTIYFLHGNAANLVYHLGLIVPFVNRGYKVFAIDYSGFGFSQGKSTRKNVIIDANDGLNYLLSRDDIQHDNILIYGQSLGGHLAASIAADNQGNIDGLIVEGAFSSHKSVANDLIPILGWLFVREMYSAKKNIQSYTKPTLVIHSIEDNTVSYRHGEKLFETAGGPKQFYSIKKKHIRGPIYYADSITFKMNQLFK